jgi:hypothetical protein
MAYYKLYVLDDTDHVTERLEMAYPDDEAAIRRSAADFPGQTVEIWDGARCVLTSTGEIRDESRTDLHRSVNILA